VRIRLGGQRRTRRGRVTTPAIRAPLPRGFDRVRAGPAGEFEPGRDVRPAILIVPEDCLGPCQNHEREGRHVGLPSLSGELDGLGGGGVGRCDLAAPELELGEQGQGEGQDGRGARRARRADYAVVPSEGVAGGPRRAPQALGDFFLVPEGGSNTAAVRGAAELPAELSLPYDVICCACGTGGTFAGIAAGLPAGKRAIGFSALKGGAFLEDEVRRLQSDYGTVTTNWSIELDYHFGGFGRRDEALDPLMLGTSAAILIALSGTSSGEPKNAAGIALLAVVLAGLFAVRLFLAERHGPDEAQVWWLRRQNPAVGGGPERLVNALVAFVDADSAAARTVDDAIRRRARGPRRGRLRAEWRRHDEARSQALRRLDWIAARNVLEVAGELVDRQRSLAVAVLHGVCPPADPRIATYQETRRRFIEEMRRTLGAGDVERVETTVEDA
jgi:hypothetical protein